MKGFVMKRAIILFLCLLFLPSVAISAPTAIYPDPKILEDMKYIEFELDSQTCEEGRIKWNSDDKTLDICTENSEVTLQTGQEMHVRGTNKTGATLTNGQVVFINGAQGSRPTFALANATTEDASAKTIGIITADIDDNATGYVTTTGLVRDIDTSTCPTGAVVYLSNTPGEFTNVAPLTPNHLVSIGVVLRSHADEGIVYVTVINGFELDEIHDVLIAGAIKNDLLIYNGTYWENSDDIIVNSITYGATYWDDLRVSLSRGRPNPTTAPDYVAFIGNTYAWAFDDTNGNERLEFDTQIPHGYVEGEDVPVHVHINSGSNSNTGNVEVILECTSWANPSGGEYAANTTIYNGVQALDGTTYKNYIFGLGDTSGSGITLSATIYCAINRNTSVAGDVTGDVIFTTIDFHVPIDAPGSRQEFVK